MTALDALSEKARAWAREASGVPPVLFDLANVKAALLATTLGANRATVMLGLVLSDIKLGECLREGKLDEHVKRSEEAADAWLAEHHVADDVREKVRACIREHHGAEKFSSLESEIVCNADCYKFLDPRGMFAYLAVLFERGKSLDEALAQAEEKLDEKWHALSLDLCKHELEEPYYAFKKLFSEAKR